MKNRQQDFALGLATIIFLTLILATILFLYPLFESAGQKIVIHFQHDLGMAPLKSGSPVILGGSITVGSVTSVQIKQLPPSETNLKQPETFFIVSAEIDANVPLHGNCKIATDQPAIGGSGFVSIIDLGSPKVPLKSPIHGLPPRSLGAAVGQISERLLGPGGMLEHLENAVDPRVEGSVMFKVLASLDDLNAITSELRLEMNPKQQDALLARVHAILDDLNTSTAAIRSELSKGNQTTLLAKVHTALDQLEIGIEQASGMLTESRPLVKDTLASVAHATRTIDRELLVALRAQLDPANPQSLMAKVHTAMDHVNHSLEDVESMTSESSRMIVLSRPTLERTLENFETMSEQLSLASQEVLLNPSRLIWGPGKQREEQLLVFQSARSFAEAARQLDESTARLKALLDSLPENQSASPAETKELQAIHNAVKNAFDRFDRAEKALWNQLK